MNKTRKKKNTNVMVFFTQNLKKISSSKYM